MIIGYIRVSTDKQENSVETQKDMLGSYSKIHGIEIDDFLELRDGFDTRMLEIEKKLKELKPQLSSSDNRLNPDDFDTDTYMKSMGGDNDE